MELSDISVPIAFIITLINLILAITTFFINRNKDRHNELQESSDRASNSTKEADAVELRNKEFQITTQLKLDQICTTTSEIKADLKAMDNKIAEFDKRLLLVETNVDTLTERVHLLENT